MTFDNARSQFATAEGYFNTATCGLPYEKSLEAMDHAISIWRAGTIHLPDWDIPINRSRAAFAEIVNITSDRVAVGSHVSVLAGTVATSIPDNAHVLMADADFSSILMPFMNQQKRGVTIKSVPLDKFIDAIDNNTTWAVISAVQSSNGKVINLEKLAAKAHQTNTRVFLDVTQAAGWLPITATNFDVVVAGTYKWLSCPRGTALMAITEEAQNLIAPNNPGWYCGEDPQVSYYGNEIEVAHDARQYDVSPAWLLWEGSAPAIELVRDLGVDAIHQHNLSLASQFCSNIGLDADVDSAVVSLAISDEIQDHLNAAKIRAAIRGGRARFCFHFYNTEKDVDLVSECFQGTKKSIAELQQA